MSTLKRSSFRISDILSEDKPSSPPPKFAKFDDEPSFGSDHIEDDRACSSKDSHSDTSSPTGSKKARKARTIFSDKQLQTLEESFEKQKYLSVQDRMELAARMGLTDTQVKTWYQNRRDASVCVDGVEMRLSARPVWLASTQVKTWYQNRRTKWKRQTAVGLELLHEANNLAAVRSIMASNPYWAAYLSTQMPTPVAPFPMVPPNPNNPVTVTTTTPDSAFSFIRC